MLTDTSCCVIPLTWTQVWWTRLWAQPSNWCSSKYFRALMALKQKVFQKLRDQGCIKFWIMCYLISSNLVGKALVHPFFGGAASLVPKKNLPELWGSLDSTTRKIHQLDGFFVRTCTTSEASETPLIGYTEGIGDWHVVEKMALIVCPSIFGEASRKSSKSAKRVLRISSKGNYCKWNLWRLWNIWYAWQPNLPLSSHAMP